MATRAPFLGTYFNKVDRKGRVSVPAPFRQVLAADPFQGIVCFASPRAKAIQGCGLGLMAELMESVDQNFDLFSEDQEAMAFSLSPMPVSSRGTAAAGCSCRRNCWITAASRTKRFSPVSAASFTSGSQKPSRSTRLRHGPGSARRGFHFHFAVRKGADPWQRHRK